MRWNCGCVESMLNNNKMGALLSRLTTITRVHDGLWLRECEVRRVQPIELALLIYIFFDSEKKTANKKQVSHVYT